MNLFLVLLFGALMGVSIGLDPYALNFFNYYMGAQYFIVEQTQTGVVAFVNPNVSESGKQLLYERMLLRLFGDQAICDKKNFVCFFPKKK